MQTRTKIKKEIILNLLRNNGGDVRHACKQSKASRTQFYDWLKTDTEFKAKVESVYKGIVIYTTTLLFSKVKSENIKATKIVCKHNLKRLDSKYRTNRT